MLPNADELQDKDRCR